MVHLAAQSLTPAVDAWLRQTTHARVLHVFEYVVNLIAGEKVLSLVTRRIGNGPFNMVVPDCDFRRYVPLSSMITIVPDALYIGDLVITLSSAARWNPYPPWAELRSKQAQLRAQIPVIQAVLQRHAPASSWANLVAERPAATESSLDVYFIECAQRHWHNLHKAINNLNQFDCVESAKHLVGLGNGLTPAGDDWLVGCGLAAQLNFPSLSAASLLLKTISLTLSGTTPFSSYWLQATINGMCNEHWHSFFMACLQADSDQVYQAAVRIVEQGHSSGSDALAGYLAILEQ